MKTIVLSHSDGDVIRISASDESCCGVEFLAGDFVGSWFEADASFSDVVTDYKNKGFSEVDFR